MQFLNIFIRSLKNKVSLYILSRYVVFSIQFLSSVYIASTLGPNLFGLWGFALMLISYLSYFNFGIDKSLNVLFIQHRENRAYTDQLVANSFFLVTLLCCGMIGFTMFLFFSENALITKYDLGNLFLLIPAIVALYHFNSIMATIYRIQNRLFELAVFQSIIPLLIFIVMFIAKGRALLNILFWATLSGHLISLCVFLINRKVSFKGAVNFTFCKTIITKAIFLFIFNVCFYLIILSSRTIISYYFTIKDFGNFTLGYTVANAILLLLQAISIIIYPKVIDRLKSKDSNMVIQLIDKMNLNYITLSYLLMFISMLFFPLFVKFMPEYKGILKLLNLTGITVLLFTNSFGYTSHLTAWNKEQKLAQIAGIALVVNILFALALVLIFNSSYDYVIVATLVAYFIFGYLSARYSNMLVGKNHKFFPVLREFFPYRLLIPYIFIGILILLDYYNLLIYTVFLFLILNRKELKTIIKTIKSIYDNPNRVDL